MIASLEEELRSRLERLEAIEEIRVLKARYADVCDTGYDPVRMRPLFTDDAVWDGGPRFGRYEGVDAVCEFFAGISSHDHLGAPLHGRADRSRSTDDGETATGSWYLLEPCTFATDDGPRAMVITGRYAETLPPRGGRLEVLRARARLPDAEPARRGLGAARRSGARAAGRRDPPHHAGGAARAGALVGVHGRRGGGRAAAGGRRGRLPGVRPARVAAAGVRRAGRRPCATPGRRPDRGRGSPERDRAHLPCPRRGLTRAFSPASASRSRTRSRSPGIPLTCGSRVLQGFVPAEDSVVADRILRAGGEVVAITNMDDLAFSGGGDSSWYGPTLNPWDAEPDGGRVLQRLGGGALLRRDRRLGRRRPGRLDPRAGVVVRRASG